MTPGQIVSIIVATIVSAIVIVFTINENKPKTIVVEDDTEKRETAETEDNNKLFSFSELVKEVTTQN